MKFRPNFAIFCSLSFVALVFGADGLDVEICPKTDPTIPPIVIPPVPESYHALIQLHSSRFNDTLNFEYARLGNGYISYEHANVKSVLIYDERRSQLITVVHPTNKSGSVACDLVPLTDGNGWNAGTKGHKRALMFAADWYLRFFANDNVKKLPINDLGKTVENGVPVQRYGVCLEWAEEKASVYMIVNMTRGNWVTLHGNKDLIPTSVSINATIDGKLVTEFATFYDFEKDRVPDGIFNIPDNVVCKDLAGLKNITEIPKSFSYQSEIITASDNGLMDFVVYQNHLFDSEMNISRFDYRPIHANEIIDTKHSHPEGVISEVHDFTSGVAYKFDETTGKCEINKIPPTADDVKVLHGDKVIITNPMAFLGLSELKYVFYKEERRRGIDALQFRAFDEKTHLIHEYWFSSSKENIQGAHIWNHRQPMTHIQYYFMDPNMNRTETNIFNFDIDRPDIFLYDVSICFKSAERRRFMFQVKGTLEQINLSNYKLFKYFIVLTIMRNAMVTPLRVTHIEALSQGDHTDIMFTLLEKKSDIGNNGILTDNELSTEDAIGMFRAQLNTGDLLLDLPSNVSIVAKGIPDSLVDITDSLEKVLHPVASSGYSSGSMGILAFFMIVAGVLIGGGIAYLYLKRR